MTRHFVRTFIALCCLAFMSVVGIYVANNCSLEKLACPVESGENSSLSSFVTNLIDRVQ